MGTTKAHTLPLFRFAKVWGAQSLFSVSQNGRRTRRGLWVVVLGPDGAGKSSVIAGIGDGVAAGFSGCDSYHLCPLTLRRRQRKVNCTPHGKAARGTLTTVLKLAYLLLLNWLSYLAVVRPRVARGRLVLFDRYFPDHVVDRKRYRVPASCKSLVELVARHVPQPDLYLVLDASARVLRERKQELPAMEVDRQLGEYRQFAERMPSAAVLSAEQPPSAVLEAAAHRIIERHLAHPTRVPWTA